MLTGTPEDPQRIVTLESIWMLSGPRSLVLTVRPPTKDESNGKIKNKIPLSG